MTFQKQYITHLKKDWRIVCSKAQWKGGRPIVAVSLFKGADCVLSEKIDVFRDKARYITVQGAIGRTQNQGQSC